MSSNLSDAQQDSSAKHYTASQTPIVKLFTKQKQKKHLKSGADLR
jgi:hypothetical protein